MADRELPRQNIRADKIVTNEIEYANGYWDDMRFPFFGQRLDTAGGRITYNTVEKGIDFADNAQEADIDGIHAVAQMPHSWKLKSEIRPHIHWIQNQALFPAWKLSYRIYTNGSLVPVSYINVGITSHAFTWVSDDLMQISGFPAIDMSGYDKVSTIIDIRITRDGAADSYVGDALGKEFDIHFLMDTPGSKTAFAK